MGDAGPDAVCARRFPSAIAQHTRRGSNSNHTETFRGPGQFSPDPEAALLLEPLWRRDGVAALATFDLTEQECRDHDLISPEFDMLYYLLTNQDVCDAAINPLHHFLRSGKLEGRRPNHWFDPASYRRSYPDVGASGTDPFTYFLRFGRSQGHAARRPDPARSAADAARVPGGLTGALGSVMHLRPDMLLQELRLQVAGSRSLTVSISQDRYPQNVGGIQILIASEQAAFNARSEAYLHLAPAAALMTLAPDSGGPIYLHATLNGVYLGAATGAEVLGALAALGPDLPDTRCLILHSLFGHSVRFLTDIYDSLGASSRAPPSAVFWVHDYATICVGYTLLRNDATFCDAPPSGSPACTICVYGGKRLAHLQAVQTLFRAIPFHVAAPSAAALALWQRKADLPHRSATVAVVLRTDLTTTRRRLGDVATLGSPGNRICVAFAGLPVVHKGWHAFVEIAAELRRSGAYRLLHLSSDTDQKLPGVEHVPTRVTPAAPEAMTAAMVEAGVDLVLVLSPWPETFCIVASEALAAGADVLTLECSGNVASLVRQTGRGRVFATSDDVAAYLASVEAIRDVRHRSVAGADAGQVRLLGATAALVLPSDDAVTPDAGSGLAILAGAT